jgi:hypothetical protein
MRSDNYDYGSISWIDLTDEEFTETARRPDVWINAARPLRVGAYILRKNACGGPPSKTQGKQEPCRTGLLFTSLFLAALAIENVLKSLLFVRHPELVANGKLSFGGKGHDLEHLAKRACFELSSDEAGFLRVSASPSIVTFGRYATPVNAKAACPSFYSLHTGSFRHFEGVFRRSVEAALREWSAAAPDDRFRIAEGMLRDIEMDVPDSLRIL